MRAGPGYAVSATSCHQEGALRFGQLAVGATILAQGIGRWVVEREAISVIAQLLQVAHERLESARIAIVGREYSTRIRVEYTSIFPWGFGLPFA